MTDSPALLFRPHLFRPHLFRPLHSRRRIIFALGGARSGKSTFARKLALNLSGKRTFIATAPKFPDEEWLERIQIHQLERIQEDWQLIEEEIQLPDAIRNTETSSVVLVDCLTLWLANLFYLAEKNGQTLPEPEELQLSENELISVLNSFSGTIILVSNEIGLGLVPDTAYGRLFRDALGRLNQKVAAVADEVYLLVAGIALTVKGG